MKIDYPKKRILFKKILVKNVLLSNEFQLKTVISTNHKQSENLNQHAKDPKNTVSTAGAPEQQ